MQLQQPVNDLFPLKKRKESKNTKENKINREKNKPKQCIKTRPLLNRAFSIKNKL